MILHAPVIITARLLPGVRVGDAFISIEPTHRCGEYDKPIWRYYIDIGGTEHSGEDLSGWESTQGMLETLLDFLSAAAESYRYSDADGENADLFPLPVVEWASQHSDELSMLVCELGETEDLIEE